MVASVRFKHCHDLAVGARPYTDRLAEMTGDVVACLPKPRIDHPLMHAATSVQREVLLVLTSNRGLCGAFNESVLRVAGERMQHLRDGGYEVLLRVVGKQGMRHFRFRKIEVDRAYRDFDDLPDYQTVRPLAEAVMDEFLAGRISGLEIAYVQFLSAGRQSASIAQVLPISEVEREPRALGEVEPVPYELHPSPPELLDRLLPATVLQRVYQCFLDSAVSEEAMRIAAMQGATESADEMIRELTIRYNRLRQSQITTELAEIIGGRAGLE